MDLLISIGHGWYMPYCNFDSPLLIRFACVQIVITKLDIVEILIKWMHLCLMLKESEKNKP
jgi:hypothetical protein